MAGILARYEALLAAGELRPDSEQRAAAVRLDALQRELERGSKQGLLGKLFGGRHKQPRGVYLWGGVGRGKSMLMDLFHQTLAIEGKRRTHFHAFMLEVHHLLKIERDKELGDPIPPVAAKIADGLQVLAFDEMVVNNSADAMIMSRLFRALIVDERVEELTEMAGEVGLTPQQLRQISLRHFGFPPKRLLRRARFLRSLLRMYAAGEADYSLRSHSYFDVSHFLRDSEEFLGMTPRRFMAQQTPYLRHILKTRSAVFGAPAQALYPIAAQG